ncbi:MAG: FHA domain-containing protein [Cyanobacteria bacterium J003]|uniref:ABC transporter ATP-binding protein/permease n=1 Tax=Thermosynechococcus sp. M3746_W2019_013 TaxID=2747806 RepID=UPI000F2B8447|nr:ABC transporter ATP-binding protein/permease [Thermosynechococcus sp. M3746_W2019_013]RMH67115.1 MAG: FHA domain-containing protein [Cyanobacteria bacterium J003]HIK23767.1 FHA domain-containing protein [Thermosynechococcus sp. M3746_W2019_013]
MTQAAWLELVKSVSEQGVQLPTGGLKIGRAPDNDLVLNDPSVSRHHAYLGWQEGRVHLTDLGSKAGTHLNGQPVVPNTPIPLENGDLITLGNSAVRFRLVWQYQEYQPGTLEVGRPTEVPVVEVRTKTWRQRWGLREQTSLLGTHPGCDVVVDTPELLPCHLKLRFVDQHLQVIDLSNPQPAMHPYLGIGESYALTEFVTLTYVGQELPDCIDTQRHAIAFSPATELRLTNTATVLAIPEADGTPTVPVKTISLVGYNTFTIGRDPSNDLVIEHPTVSRHHAKIERRNGDLILTDLASSNGTFVNGREVETPTLLRVGDSIRIGSDRLVLNVDETLTQYAESGHMRLDAINLTKVVGKGTRILHDISLSIMPKEFVAILGPSGSGKSTLLDALNGLRPATTGTVLVNGTNFYRNYQAFQAQLGYVPQKNIIHEELTIAQALEYAAKLRMPPDTTAAERQRRVTEVLTELGLNHRRDVPISRLSGGQQRRVCIGAELLTQPSLFFLDEATSGLDPGTEADLMFLLRQLADQGRTILIITHATQNIRECDLVIYLAEGGRLAYFGPPDQLLPYFRATFGDRLSGIKLEDFSGIYRALDKEKNPHAPTSEELEQAYRRSRLYQEYVVGRQQALAYMPDESQRSPKGKSGRSSEPKSKISPWQQFLILIHRNLTILSQDRIQLLLTLLIAPLLASLNFVSWRRDLFNPETGNGGQALTMIFVTSLIAVMIGAMTTMRELVKEVEVYRRERLVGLRLLPYLGSKVAIALGLALYQAATYLAVTKLAVDLPGDWGVTFAMYITFALAIFGGMAMGLLVSALAPSQNIVPLLVLMFLVPQIIFSGGIQPVSSFGLPGQIINHLTVIKWPFEAMVKLTGMGDDIANDPCWREPEEERQKMTEQMQREFCLCYGPGLFQTCNFPGIRSKYVPTVDEPAPPQPEPPGDPPNDPAALQDYLRRLQAYQAAMDEWEVKYSEWNRQRSRAINEAQGTISRFQRDQGYMFTVNVQRHWRDQSLLILAMLVALPFCQKRRDFGR